MSEWGATTVRSDPAFFALFLISLWLVSRGRSRTTVFERCALAGAGLLALYAGRYVIWFALLVTLALPFALDGIWSSEAGPRRGRLNPVLAALSALVALGATAAAVAHGNGWFERGYPPAAEAAIAAAARSDPKLDVFANEKYADWLLFEDPALKGRVAYDIRFELLSHQQFASLVAFRNERGVAWQQAARGYRLLVLDPSSDGETINIVEHRAGATVLFRSRDVVVVRRARTASSP